MLEGYVPGDIELYEFDEAGALVRALLARKAIVHPDRRWVFIDVRVKESVNGSLQTRQEPEVEIENLWSPQELPSLTLTERSMTLTALYRYSEYLRSNGRSPEQYLSAFWRKVSLPLTVGAMVLLAMPMTLSLGSGRDLSFGAKMGMVTATAILFYLGSEIVIALGLLLEVSVLLVCLIPTLVVAAFAAILLARMRW
jgi:lipopolysaccharide export system permease protein